MDDIKQDLYINRNIAGLFLGLYEIRDANIPLNETEMVFKAICFYITTQTIPKEVLSYKVAYIKFLKYKIRIDESIRQDIDKQKQKMLRADKIKKEKAKKDGKENTYIVDTSFISAKNPNITLIEDDLKQMYITINDSKPTPTITLKIFMNILTYSFNRITKFKDEFEALCFEDIKNTIDKQNNIYQKNVKNLKKKKELNEIGYYNKVNFEYDDRNYRVREGRVFIMRLDDKETYDLIEDKEALEQIKIFLNEEIKDG